MPRTFQMTPAHLAAFAHQQRQRFEDEMVVYLQREYPAECSRMGDPRIRDLIRKGIEKAKGYDLTLEADVAGYVELMVVVSPDFHESEQTPWAKEILTRHVPGATKLDQIYEHLMFGPARGEMA